MRHIHRVTAAETIAGLPDLDSYQKLRGEAIACDVLIVAAGFEDRAAAITEVSPKITPRTCMIVTYPTNRADNARIGERLARGFNDGHVVEVPYGHRHFRRSLVERLVRLGTPSDAKVVVDLSGMSSYVIYRVLYVLFEHFPGISLQLFYAEAEEYFLMGDN